jgi:hypothetical protein
MNCFDPGLKKAALTFPGVTEMKANKYMTEPLGGWKQFGQGQTKGVSLNCGRLQTYDLGISPISTIWERGINYLSWDVSDTLQIFLTWDAKN